MAYSGTYSSGALGYGDFSALRSEGREPGARRKKIAGYLKAANELRQTYFSQDGTHQRDGGDYAGVEGPGAFPDAAVVRSGNEEMILFPSYGRKHVKSKPRPQPTPGSDISEQEYWRREWDRHEDDNAIVDVDVRGWIYTPHRGHANRKQRLMIGLARQLSGVPAPPASKPGDFSYASSGSSRASSPTRETPKQDEELIAREANNIVRKGEQERRYARHGAYSENPGRDGDGESIYGDDVLGGSRNTLQDQSKDEFVKKRLSQASLASSADGDAGSLTPPKRQESWSQATKMSAAELQVANQHLLSRLRPFMATPLANSPISAFFYNDNASRQHTVYTNASGHFSCRAALDFMPTHVRVLAGEKLSATEEVTITSPTGVSMISDIDDTVKHSAISSGAREIFRNAFVRDLGDLTIEGVREWYNTLSDMGVQLHYVSNSPWQMYPMLTTFFKLAHLPRGSFHLKQYSGMLQGIFEPVAERKKSNLDKIMRDFPNRKFILIGDSGEADLEVYTDVALDNPGRILGVFIRDVTTPVQTGYFDPSNNGPPGGKNSHSHDHSRSKSGDTDLSMSKRLSRPTDIKDDDKDLQAAIAASLADMEEETRLARKNINPDLHSADEIGLSRTRPDLPPRRVQNLSVTGSPVIASPGEDLIDFSDDPVSSKLWLAPPPRDIGANSSQSDGAPLTKKPSPSPPPKPRQLRSPSPTTESQQRAASPNESRDSIKTPPPRPRKPSSAVKPPAPQQIQTWTSTPPSTQTPPVQPQHQPSPLWQVVQQSPVENKKGKSRPPLPTRPKSSRGLFGSKEKPAGSTSPNRPWESDANFVPPRPRTPSGGPPASPRLMSTASAKSAEALRPLTEIKPTAPVPPPRRRQPTLPPVNIGTRRASSNRLSGGWDDLSNGSLPASPSEAGVSRKEFLWIQRWARAKRTLESQGVTLRTWRVGSDVADVCVKLVEHALRDIEKEKREHEYRSRNT